MDVQALEILLNVDARIFRGIAFVPARNPVLQGEARRAERNPLGGGPLKLSSPYSENSVACAKNHCIRWLLLVGVLLLVGACQVFAQEAVRVGTITDPTGVAQPNVSLRSTKNGHCILQFPRLVQMFAKVMR
jgi:hypothetical protein